MDRKYKKISLHYLHYGGESAESAESANFYEGQKRTKPHSLILF